MLIVHPGGHCFHCHQDFTEKTEEHLKNFPKKDEPSYTCKTQDCSPKYPWPPKRCPNCGQQIPL